MVAERRKPRVIWFGAAVVTLRDQVARLRRSLTLEFPDTRSLEAAVNRGDTDFDLADDTLAVMVDGKGAGSPPA